MGRRYWFNLLRAALFFLAVILLALTAWMGCLYSQIYIHPPRHIASGNSLNENNIEYRDIELHTEDGITLSAWYTPPKNGAVILLAHGYSGFRTTNYYLLFAKRGFGVLAWDFRAHGESGGDFSTLGDDERLDVEAALDYALAQSGVRHVGAWGGSMGGATVILTAAYRPEIEAVVSDSAYPTLEDAYRVGSPATVFQPMMFFIEMQTGANIDDVRPVDEIGKISPRPVFIIDGWEGAAVIMNSPYRLHNAAGDPKTLWVEEGVPHFSMYAYYPEEYAQRVIDFFEEYLVNTAPSH